MTQLPDGEKDKSILPYLRELHLMYNITISKIEAEKWASKILEEKKEELKKKLDEDFENFMIYGKTTTRNGAK